MKGFTRALLILGLSCSAVCSLSVHAAVQPSFYLVRKMAKRHQNLGEARIKSRVFILDKDGRTEQTFIETMAISESGKVHIRLASEDGSKSVIRERRSVFSDSKRPFSYDLLFIPSEESISARFLQLGFPLKSETELYAVQSPNTPYIPEETVGLTRFENKVVQFFAASLTRGPQLFFEKESVLPVRAVLPEGFGKTLEIKFSRYTELPAKQGAFLYPAQQLYLRGGENWIKIELLDSKFGPGAANLDSGKAKSEELSESFLGPYFEVVR